MGKWTVDKTYKSLGHPDGIMAFKRVCDVDDVISILQVMADKLNYADEHMPPPKKTVEEFLAMEMGKLNELLGESINEESSIPRWCRTSIAYYTGWCWSVLRPEIRKRGYLIKILDNEDCKFTLDHLDEQDFYETTESSTVTLSKFVNACYLYVMQEEGAK